jgi:hypothetical protein
MTELLIERTVSTRQAREHGFEAGFCGRGFASRFCVAPPLDRRVGASASV